MVSCFMMGVQQGEIFCPDIMLTAFGILLVMCMLSRILLLKTLGSWSRMLVDWNENVWPVVARWNGIPLSKVSLGCKSVRSPWQDFWCSAILTPSFLLVWPM
jgi:hypothetical protein